MPPPCPPRRLSTLSRHLAVSARRPGQGSGGTTSPLNPAGIIFHQHSDCTAASGGAAAAPLVALCTHKGGPHVTAYIAGLASDPLVQRVVLADPTGHWADAVGVRIRYTAMPAAPALGLHPGSTPRLPGHQQYPRALQRPASRYMVLSLREYLLSMWVAVVAPVAGRRDPGWEISSAESTPTRSACCRSCSPRWPSWCAAAELTRPPFRSSLLVCLGTAGSAGVPRRLW
jgi:hypothetical protein